MFRNTMFAAQRAKDALVDRFRKKQGNVYKCREGSYVDPDITFFIHLSPKGMDLIHLLLISLLSGIF